VFIFNDVKDRPILSEREESGTWFSLQKMFRFKSSNMGNCCKNMSKMGRGSFNAVSMVDLSFSGFLVRVEMMDIVVEINVTRAKISIEKRLTIKEK